MSAFGQTRAWLRAVMLRGKAERDMHQEMAAHIEQAAERFMSRGMSERDALHVARREFGAVAVIQEQARDSRGGRWADNFTTDVRYAFRYFVRTPLVTITIVFTLMLGVGVSSAGFSLLNAALLRPPGGIPVNSSLVTIRGIQTFFENPNTRLLSLAEVQAYAALPVFEMSSGWRSFHGIADIGNGGASVDGVRATYVLPNYFATLGVLPIAGSGLYPPTPGDSNRVDLTAVISFQLARERFGGASEAIGKTLRLNDVIVTVVGVTPPKFTGINGGPNVLYLPLSAMRVVESARSPSELSNDSLEFRVVARLRAGVSVREAMMSVKAISGRFSRPPDAAMHRVDAGADVVPLRADNQVRGKNQLTEDLVGAFGLAALNLLILLMCTTTVSSLLVGTAVTRSHEIGVRLALGAGRDRIVRQLLTESAILSLLGGALGLALFAVLCRVFGRQLAGGLDLTPTWSTAAFTALFAVLTALMCGLSPALHATRHSLSDVLKNSQTGTTARTRLQRLFVVAQIAIAQPVLVVLAMLTVLVLHEIRRESDLTVNESTIVAQFDENSSAHIGSASAELKNLNERIAGLPGVTRVIPWSEDFGASTTVELWSPPGSGASVSARSLRFEFKSVAPDYFDAMEIPLIAGRRFSPSDTSSDITPLIVSSDFAVKALGSSQVIGARFCFMSCRGSRYGNGMYEIVGVVQASKLDVADDGRAIKVFSPYLTTKPHAWLIKSEQSPAATIAAIHNLARTEAPHIPVQRVATIAERNRGARDVMLQISSAAAGGGFITLLLGCIGLYAVVALAVNQRRREIGIRIAMGARPTQVVTQFFKGGLRLSIVGLAIGLPLSAAVIRILGNQVGLPKTNTVAIALFIAGVVILVASFATWLPARKAAGVDPLVALRAE